MIDPSNISLESLNLMTLVPMLIAVSGGLLILITDLINDKFTNLCMLC